MAHLHSRLALGLVVKSLFLLALGLGRPVSVAEEKAPSDGIYDRPVLVVDPGMHTAPIRALDADPGGRFLVTASSDKTVRIWAAGDGRLLRTIRLPAGPDDIGQPFATAISPDGTLVATAGWTLSRDHDVYLFDRASGDLIRRVGGLPDVVNHLVFSPNGSRLVATLWSGGIRLIDPELGRIVAADEWYVRASYGAAYDPISGRLATTALDGRVRLYSPDLDLLRVAQAPSGRTPWGIAFSPDGTKLALGYSHSHSVDVLDGLTLDPLFPPDIKGVNKGNLAEVVWSRHDGSLLAAGSWGEDHEIRLRRWQDGGRGAPIDHLLSHDTAMGLRSLPGGRLAFAAQDPRLGVLDTDGREVWAVVPVTADFRVQSVAVSADGSRIRFGYGQNREALAMFSLPDLRLEPGGSVDGFSTARTEAPGLTVESWKNSDRAPTLNGHRRLALDPDESSRSLAVAPDGERSALGADWSLSLFDREGTMLWRRSVPGVVDAVIITSDGRLIVAAYSDGTIRWHRIDDGAELLAFFPLADGTNWVAWTPEGFYAATPGAYGVLRWHVNRGWDEVNRGWDEAPESVPVSDIRELRRPDVLPLVLQELDVVRVVGVAGLADARRAVQARTRSAVVPGAQLHVLAVGVGRYNETNARHLSLEFADNDASDIASALDSTQAGPHGLYAAVKPQFLADREATKAGIMDALAAMRAGMAAGSGRDLAVVHFSGHGAMLDGRLYLLPYEVDARTPARIKGSALAADDLRAELAELGKLGRVLVLLDACHSGAAAGDGTGVAADAGLLRAALAAPNVTVLTSSSGAEVSREDPAWGNGAFTEALLEALGIAADTDRDGLVGVSELMAHLGRRVPALTEGRQTPGIEVRFDGGLFAAGL